LLFGLKSGTLRFHQPQPKGWGKSRASNFHL